MARSIAIVNFAATAIIEGIVTADPDDNHVIACALSAQADAIVSDNSDLLNLKQYRGMRIVPVAQALAMIGAD